MLGQLATRSERLRRETLLLSRSSVDGPVGRSQIYRGVSDDPAARIDCTLPQTSANAIIVSSLLTRI